MTALAGALIAPGPAATLAVSDSADGRELRLSGRLDAYSIAGVWAQARNAVAQAPDRKVTIDASRVDYCDGGGIAMLVDLLRQERSPQATVTVRGLRPEFQTLLNQFDPVSLRAPHAEPEERLHAVQEIGRAALITWGDIKTQVAFVGETSSALWFAMRNPRSVRWKDVWYTCEQVGVNAVPTWRSSHFCSAILVSNRRTNAPARRTVRADLVDYRFRNWATDDRDSPRGRHAAFAEIGTMKVNEELNALTTMGLDPVRFLVVTRIIAAVLMVPLLTLFANMVGILGGALTMISFNIPVLTFLREVDSLVDLGDLWAGMAKTPVYAMLIAGIGCLRGLQTQTGASAVGISATRAVVSGIILLVFVDGIYAFIYYLMDI